MAPILELMDAGERSLGDSLDDFRSQFEALNQKGEDERSDGQNASAPPAVRAAAYGRFRESIQRAAIAVNTLTELKPGLVGAVWTWPAALRSNRALLENTTNASIAFAEITAVGTKDPVQAASKVLEGFFKLCQEVEPPEWWSFRHTPQRRAGYETQRTALYALLREFIEMSRRDLGWG